MLPSVHRPPRWALLLGTGTALVLAVRAGAVVVTGDVGVLPGTSTAARDPRAHCVPGRRDVRAYPAPRRTLAAYRPAPEAGPGRVEIIEVPAADAPGGSHEVWIYRPDVPESASLPVVYFLHGVPGGDRDVEQSMLVPYLEQAFAEGQRPFVVVAPDGNSTGAEDSEWADSPAGGVRVESFVTGALIDAVEGPARRDPAHRAIVGFSMGGYGAMNLAMRHRDLYGSVASLAGYFHVDDPSHVFGTDPATLNANSPKQHPAQAIGLRVLIADGTGDDEPAVRGEAVCFAPLLRRVGVPVQLDLMPGTHSYDWLDSELPGLLRFLEVGWPVN